MCGARARCAGAHDVWCTRGTYDDGRMLRDVDGRTTTDGRRDGQRTDDDGTDDGTEGHRTTTATERIRRDGRTIHNYQTSLEADKEDWG